MGTSDDVYIWRIEPDPLNPDGQRIKLFYSGHHIAHFWVRRDETGQVVKNPFLLRFDPEVLSIIEVYELLLAASDSEVDAQDKRRLSHLRKSLFELEWDDLSGSHWRSYMWFPHKAAAREMNRQAQTPEGQQRILQCNAEVMAELSALRTVQQQYNKVSQN